MQISRDPHVARALEWLSRNTDWINAEQARITAIPAPPFHESERAAYVQKILSSYALRVSTDRAGNVIGELPGSQENQIVVLAAHLDTVFPAGTDVHVRKEGARMLAPGISDNGTGLATLVAIARGFHEANLKPARTILFVANVGEEGEGNLRGMRALVDEYKDRLKYVIALDGSGTDYITTMALGSRRIEIVVNGPGGHSWSDFGLPNPINAVARGITRFLKMRVPDSPRTTFNIGQIEGGTSVNSIPFRASIRVDLRSEQEQELERLETHLRESMKAGVDEEMAATRERGSFNSSGSQLEMGVHVLGVRPGGELAANSNLLAAVRNADTFLGNSSRLERSSTDANIPISIGIDAISIGAGGASGGAHSLKEWYDPTDRLMGLKRVLLTLLAVAGMSPADAH
ncbi:MAG TPA: M20/M25/M40 family metallo-hydrolase [Candidatus Dormibacteraeota bacterium]|nr:M20/M25/M40 family metallo-hydrolase [Candidatus Dormibacteraeota bacterium]